MTVTIHPTAEINVADLQLGEGTVIHPYCRLEGTKIHLGRETILDRYTVIGGGSCFDPQAELVAGDFLMTGMFSQINIGRPVHIGDEFGLGIQARVFSHEAWLSEYDGFPCKFEGVTIGDRVWVPDGLIRPGTKIGSDVVIGAGSVVSGEIPSGSFAAGVPAKVLRLEHEHPKKRSLNERFDVVEGIVKEVSTDLVVGWGPHWISVDGTMFDLELRSIGGAVNDDTEKVRHQLRRHGIRFRYSPIDGQYQPW